MADNENEIVSQVEILMEESFVGKYGHNELLDHIYEQFTNYMNVEDHHNYVSIFYTQFKKSLIVTWDEDIAYTDAPQRRECLQLIYDRFTQTLIGLISSKLEISIKGFDENTITSDDLEFIITRIYEYFILNARRNFKVAISHHVNSLIKVMRTPDDNYFNTVQEMVETNYNPTITAIAPLEFLRFTGNKELVEMFENHLVVGNFLIRYTPRLYNNPEFTVELINYITAHRDLGSEFKKLNKEENENGGLPEQQSEE